MKANLYNPIRRVASIVFILLSNQFLVWGQTNPTLHDLSSGSYTFNYWAASEPAGTYPANMRFWQTGTSDPQLSAIANADYTGAYNLTSGTRINGLGADGFSFINTSTSGNLGMAVVGLNTTGRTNIQVSWTGGTVQTNPRVYRIRLQYRIGTGSWTDVSGPIEYQSNTTGHSQTFGPTTLPAAVDDQPEVYVRWFYYYVSGSGARPQLRVDDITISSSPIVSHTITTGTITGSPFCITPTTGASVSVPYTFTGSFSGTFTAQLSDATGSFASPVNIGSGASPISATIPAGTPSGTGYRIRVVNDNPVTTGTPNPDDLAIYLNVGDPTNPTISSTPTTQNIGWTNPLGCFDEILVVARQGSAVSYTPTGDGAVLTANQVFGSGTDVGSFQYVVYKGTGTSVTVTGLTTGQTYHYAIYARNDTNWSTPITTSSLADLSGYYWNGGDNTANPANGGTGNWLGANNWRQPFSNGSAATWADSNNAILAGTAGVVTLTGDVTATEVFVNSTGYTIITNVVNTRQLNAPITLAAGVNLNLMDSTATANRTLEIGGDITGGTGASLTIQGNQASGAANRINLSASGAMISVPITITDGGTGGGVSGIVATASGTQLTSAATITNNSNLRTMIGATSGNSITINSVISGSAGLQFSAGNSGGAGTITLNVANTYTGSTIFNATNSGVVLLGVENALPTSTDVIMANSSGYGGILDLNGFNQTLASISNGPGGGSIRNNTGTATLTINGSASTTFSLPITNTGGTLNLVRSGTGSTELTGECTYTGTTTVNGGTLRLNRSGGNTLPATNDVIVNGGTLRISTNQTLNDLTIASGGTVLVDAGAALTVTGTLTNNGTITLEASSKTDYARLIYGATAGTGTVNHQMRLVPGSSYKWYGIGSPIDGININSIGSGQFTSTSVYSWGATTGWSPAHTSTFSRGQGYLIAAGENSPHGFFTIPADNSNITFSGTLNANTSAVVRTMSWGDAPTGVTFTSDSTKGWNLLANPYHADFDVNLLTLDNQSLEKSLYIRTTTGYTAYNPIFNTPDSLRYLAPGQGFFVRATADAQTFTFDLSRRSSSGSNGLQKPQFTFDKINIRVFTSNRADDTYVIFKSDATPAFDGLYDAYKLNNVNGHPMLYTRLNNLSYAINTLPELSGQFSLPMHFSCSEGGQYSITLPAQQDFDPSISIVLEDKLLKTHTLLNNADYTFAHNPVNNPDRFVLHFSKSQVSAEEFAADAFNAWVYNGILYLKGFKNLGTTSISLVDMSGRVVYSTRADVHGNERVEIALPKLATGMYVLRVASGVQSRSMKVLLN